MKIKMEKKPLRPRRIANRGSSFDSFLEQEGILDEVDKAAIGRVTAWQFARRAKARGLNKHEQIDQMTTNRPRNKVRD